MANSETEVFASETRLHILRFCDASVRGEVEVLMFPDLGVQYNPVKSRHKASSFEIQHLHLLNYFKVSCKDIFSTFG